MSDPNYMKLKNRTCLINLKTGTITPLKPKTRVGLLLDSYNASGSAKYLRAAIREYFTK